MDGVDESPIFSCRGSEGGLMAKLVAWMDSVCRWVDGPGGKFYGTFHLITFEIQH